MIDKKNCQKIDLSSPMQIGSISCRNRVFLAPMSGISDVPFRKLAWKFGAGLVFSEMVASEALAIGQFEMEMKAQSAGLPVHAVQLAGRQAEWMALAAKISEDNGADLLDNNMGCPSRRVTSGLSGSALMCDLDHAMSLIDAVVSAVDIPVTLKMRLGWDEHSINAPQLAKRAQSAGIAMISVHGRTRCQFYKGRADWQAIREVREVTSIPLVVNGDITNLATAITALDYSQADAVMIGRATNGAPWLAGEIAGISGGFTVKDMTEPSAIGNVVLEHFEEMLLHYGIETGIRQFRKHLGWYLDSVSRNNSVTHPRIAMLTSDDPNQIRELISRVFFRLAETEAA